MNLAFHIVALFGFILLVHGQEQVSVNTQNYTAATASQAFDGFTSTYRSTRRFSCDPEVADFIRRRRPSIFPENPCMVLAQPAVVREMTPVVADCCPIVHEWAYLAAPEDRIAVLDVSCADICCKLCGHVPICRSWSYRYSTRKCVLNRVAATPFYWTEAAGNNIL